ncbi:long-chain-fatty-acid--CoA ligase [Chachezhania sediminis]|uniref:long-chain-fatty-acid--CoA ligase n=1 Tax=Chachezhania sediminis TaxID=2599291 RepID=UPI00131CF3F0|nr:long-chain-fatty-acid--CoA ligase [Chachezhania sediminis]
MRFHDYFEYHADMRPAVPFLIQGDRIVSYAEAERLANRIANAMIASGVKVGDRIAYLGKNSIEHALVYLAAAKAGAAPIPLNFRLAPKEWAYIISHSGSRMLFATEEYMYGIDSVRGSLSSVETFVSVGTERAGWQGWDRWLDASDRRPDVPVTDRDSLYIMYTSGTTGMPKGVVLTHANILAHLDQAMVATSARRSPGERALIVTPLYHAAGALRVFAAGVNGTTCVLHESFSPDGLVKALKEYRINTINMVPAIIQSLLDDVPDIASMTFDDLRVIYYGAAPISVPLLQRTTEVFRCDLIQGYGLTEATGALTYLNEYDHEKALKGQAHLLESAGKPAVGTKIRICDDDGRELPRGEVGEIVAKGPQIMKGYWQDKAATDKVLDADGWLRTGDAGMMDGEGYVYLKDRIKDMIVSGGENIYPVEVENALSEHRDIAECAVIGVPDVKYGETVMAVCVMRAGASLTADDVIAHCRQHIGGYKVPRKVTFLDALPRNASGKVLKRVLREPYWENRTRQVG